MRGAVTSTGNGDILKRLVSHARARLGYSIVLSLACVGILAAALLSYRAIDRELTESALSRRAAVARLAAAVLSEKFAHLADIGTSLATRVRFRELIEAGEWVEAGRVLGNIPRDFPFIDRITLHDVGGTLMADIPEAPAVGGQNFAHRDWYQGVMRNGRPYVSQVYKRAAPPQVNVFVAAVPVKSGKGEVLGILVVQVRTDTFFEWTRGMDVGHSGFIYVVDSRGTLAAHPNFPPEGSFIDYSNVPVVQRVLQGKRGVEIAYNPVEKEQRVVAYEPIAKHGWGVLLEQPAATVFETRDDQLQLVLAAYGLILLFIAIMTYLVSRIASQRRQFEEDHRMKAELERRVAERTAQLEASNKELESFSYSVSHDLRSPLRAVDGFSRILEEDYAGKLDDEARRLLRVIRDNSQKMGGLIDDLLEFSRLGRKSLSTAWIDMKRLVEEVLGELQVSGEKPRLVLGELPPARGDATLLKLVWTNLLDNAIKFSGKRERPLIEMSGHENGAESVYCVKDNGVGFDMQYYDKLFGVFQRLHSAQEFDGTGVGLAIVQRVVNRHGGRVWAEGKVNEGAAFYFALPKGSGA